MGDNNSTLVFHVLKHVDPRLLFSNYGPVRDKRTNEQTDGQTRKTFNVAYNNIMCM